MERWYESYFNNNALDTWQLSRSEELTALEVDYLEVALGGAGSRSLLDIACGNGRHAVGLAKRGHHLVGLDITAANRERLAARAKEAGVEVDFVRADMRDMQLERSFDGGYCWGNSVGYFPRAAMAEFLGGVARVLRPGAPFVLETATVAESILVDLARSCWFQITDDMRVMLECSYDVAESRLDTEYSTLKGGTLIDTSTAHVWVFTCGELAAMAEAADFDVVSRHADFDGSAFELGSERLILNLRRR